MDKFRNALVDALTVNNGRLEHPQVVELIDPVSRHKLMNWLVPLRNEGVIELSAEKVNGKFTMVVSSPQSTVQAGGE